MKTWWTTHQPMARFIDRAMWLQNPGLNTDCCFYLEWKHECVPSWVLLGWDHKMDLNYITLVKEHCPCRIQMEDSFQVSNGTLKAVFYISHLYTINQAAWTCTKIRRTAAKYYSDIQTEQHQTVMTCHSSGGWLVKSL